MRTTGIDAVGSVPWGTHFCQFYQDKQDLIDILVPYLSAGLRRNEFCLWVACEPLGVDEAKAALAEVVGDLDPYLRTGQLEVLDCNQWYAAGGTFDANRVLQGWVEKLAVARQRGFEGLRLAANTFWLEQSTWRDFAEYEALVDGVISRHAMLAVCTYSLAKCGVPEILDVMANHAFTLVKRGGTWQVVRSAERKRSEEALRQSEERFAAAFHTTNAGFVLLRAADGVILDANRAWLDMVGWSRNEVIGKTTRDLNLHVDISEREHLRVKMSQSDSIGIPELLIKRKDGQVRVHSLFFREVTLQGERCHLGTAQDITELVEARGVLEAALSREQQLAEEKDQSRVQLVRLLAHEIRNPMAALKGLAQVIGLKATDDCTRELTGKMSKEVDRLSTMLSQVLDAFRAHAGSLPMDFRVLDLAGMVESAIDFHRSEETHPFELTMDRGVMVKGDASRLEDVLRNLLSNATKFSNPGSPIHAELAIRGDTAVLAVRDHGVGIPPDELDRVFELFFRASNIAFQGPGGAGLGLHLCKHIVERHGGRLWVESELGSGSTFYVQLPLDATILDENSELQAG